MVLRSLSDRIITGFIIVWITTHQGQIVKQENQLTAVSILLFLLFPASWAKEALSRVELPQYRLTKTFLVVILELVNTGVLWVLISVVSTIYTDSMKPFVTLDTIYRTVVGIVIVAAIVVTIEEFPRADQNKPKAE
jgi:hypothetical protein